VSSVKKKLKDKAFARSVNRDDIRQGIEELGVDLDEHIRFVIDALRPVQTAIGLNPLRVETQPARAGESIKPGVERSETPGSPNGKSP
jgi:hypothetical protein